MSVNWETARGGGGGRQVVCECELGDSAGGGGGRQVVCECELGDSAGGGVDR